MKALKVFKLCATISVFSVIALFAIAMILNNFLYINKPLQTAIHSNVMIGTERPFDRSFGSGVVFKNGDRIFIWTCHHVISNAINIELKLDVDKVKYITRRDLDQPLITSKIFNENNEDIGEARFHARIIRFSAADDLALLELPANNCFKTSAHFPLRHNYHTQPGMKLLHVGNFGGPPGMFSVSEGIAGINGLDLDNDGKCYDRVGMNFQPGSSGGGIYEVSSGRCVGIVARTINRIAYNQGLMVPYRRMVDFAQRLDCIWALNARKEVPWDYLSTLTDDEYTLPPNLLHALSKLK